MREIEAFAAVKLASLVRTPQDRARSNYEIEKLRSVGVKILKDHARRVPAATPSTDPEAGVQYAKHDDPRVQFVLGAAAYLGGDPESALEVAARITMDSAALQYLNNVALPEVATPHEHHHAIVNWIVQMRGGEDSPLGSIETDFLNHTNSDYLVMIEMHPRVFEPMNEFVNFVFHGTPMQSAFDPALDGIVEQPVPVPPSVPVREMAFALS